MQLRKYRYDVKRATDSASLARLLKICKLEHGQEPLGKPKVCELPVTRSDKARDKADQLTFELILGHIAIIFGLNLRSNTIPKDFEIYSPFSTRPIVALYPDNLLPQAEDAHDLYTRLAVREEGVYTDAHLHFLTQARRFRRDNGQGQVFVSSDFALDLFLQVGLEDIDYSRWKGVSKTRYIDGCINDRAVTYLLGKIVQLSLIREGFEDESAVNVGALSEVAYGPLPLARLGDFAIAHPELFHDLVVETGVTESVNLLLLNRSLIIQAASRLAAKLCIKEFGVDLASLVNVERLIRRIRPMVHNVRSLYLPEQPKAVVEPPVLAVVSRALPAPIQLKPSFDSFCVHCNVAIRRTRASLYQDLYDLATRDEINNVLKSSPWAIKNLLVRHRDELEARGHDSGAISLELFVNRFRDQFTNGPEPLLTTLYHVLNQKTIDYLMENPSGLARIIQENRAELESRYFDIDFVLQELKEKRERVVRLVS